MTIRSLLHAGTINLFYIRRELLQSGTIGYRVDHPRNGRGLATGAVGEILSYAFGEPALHRVEAATSWTISRRRDGDWRDFLLFQRIAEN